MRTLERDETETTSIDKDDELVHIVCECDLNVTFCGINVENVVWEPDDSTRMEYVVCVDVAEVGCAVCDARSSGGNR